MKHSFQGQMAFLRTLYSVFLVDIYPLCDYYECNMAFGVYFAATWKRYTPFHPSACLTIVLTGRPIYVLCVKLTLEQADTSYAYVRND